MPANIRVGGVRVDFSANDSRYQAVARSVEASNRRLTNSYRSVGRSASRQGRLLTQFTGSLQSSLIATVAYAAGVHALTSVVFGSTRAFLDWEKGLIAVQKTTGLTDAGTARLGENFDRLLTRTSSLNRALPVTPRTLLEIAEVAGQMNVRGVPNIERFTETVALMTLTTDLAGSAAANALGLIITNTDALIEDVPRLGAVITALGNQFRGGEGDIVSLSQELARSTAEFDFSAREILAYAAVLSQAGSRQEKAGTVFQRTFRALINAANEAFSGQPDRLQAIANATDNAEESYANLVETIKSGDLGAALQILLDALQNLESVGTQQTRGNLITLLFGGDQGPPVRIAEVIGVLVKQIPEITRALAISNEEWEQQIALLQEAGKFAEANALRLQVVQNQLQSQAISIGEGLTAVFVPVAENFKVLELAVVAAGTALTLRFGRNRLRAISDAGLRFNRDLQLQEQIARSAVVSAQREVAAVAVANRASLATGFQRLTLAENLARAELKAAAATRVHAISVAALSRANRIGASATRASSAALAFVGGPIGAITLALTAGVAAWQLWGGTADEETQQSDDLIDRLKRIADEAENLGVTLNQQTIRESTERISRLNEELAKLREPSTPQLQNIRDPFSGGEPGLRGVLVAQQRADERRRRERIAALEAERDALTEVTEKAVAANEEIERSAAASDGLDRVASSFQAISLALDDPTRQIRDFINELERATEIATQRARFDLSIAPLPQFEQDVQIAILERREAIQERLLQLEQDLGDQIQDQGRARALLSQTEAIRDQFAIGTKTREEAERQVGQAQRQADEQDRQVDLRRQALEFARSQLRVDQDLLETQIRAQNLARNAQALNQPLSIDPADLRSQARAAEDFTQQIQLRVDSQEREARQLAELTGLRQVDQAALQARFAVLNRFSDAQIRADADIIRAEEQLIESRRELARVTASLGETSSQEDRNLLLSSRQRSADAAVALAEARAYRDELERQGPAALAAADASAEAQARIAQIQIDGASRLQLATNLAVSGVRSTEDAIVELATTGPIAFKEFADAIVADLLRIIVRATFTVNLLRFLGLGAGGEATGGGLLGRLGIGGGARSVSGLFSGPAVLHEGGVAGNLGALGSNEVLARLEKGEEVLTRQDPRHRYNIGDLISRLPRYHDGGVVGGDRRTARPETMRIVIENRSSTPLEAVQTTQRTDVNQHITTIILDDVRRKGPITRGLSQRLGRPF